MRLSVWKAVLAIVLIGGLFYFVTGYDIKRSTILQLPATVTRGKTVNASVEVPSGRLRLENGTDTFTLKDFDSYSLGSNLVITYTVRAVRDFGASTKDKFIGLDSAIYDNEGNRVYWQETVGVTRMTNGETLTEVLTIPLSTFSKSEVHRVSFWINEDPSEASVEKWTDVYNKLSFDRMIDGDASNNAVSARDVEDYLDNISVAN